MEQEQHGLHGCANPAHTESETAVEARANCVRRAPHARRHMPRPRNVKEAKTTAVEKRKRLEIASAKLARLDQIYPQFAFTDDNADCKSEIPKSKRTNQASKPNPKPRVSRAMHSTAERRILKRTNRASKPKPKPRVPRAMHSTAHTLAARSMNTKQRQMPPKSRQNLDCDPHPRPRLDYDDHENLMEQPNPLPRLDYDDHEVLMEQQNLDCPVHMQHMQHMHIR